MKKSIIFKFLKDDWNGLKSATSDKYPYIKFFKNKVYATNKKIVVIKKFNKVISEKPFFLHRDIMKTMVGDNNNSYVRVLVNKDGRVYIRYLEHKPFIVKEAYKKVNFPKINPLKKLESDEVSNSVSFSLTRSTLVNLLECTTDEVIHIRAHSDIYVAKWKSGSMSGFLSQVKPEPEKDYG